MVRDEAVASLPARLGPAQLSGRSVVVIAVIAVVVVVLALVVVVITVVVVIIITVVVVVITVVVVIIVLADWGHGVADHDLAGGDGNRGRLAQVAALGGGRPGGC